MTEVTWLSDNNVFTANFTGFAVIVAYGIGAMCFLLYGPVNKILPFMLLGIGIDDVFVIMQSWSNLYPSCLTKKSKLSIPERMGICLKHAGVSITVTSLTGSENILKKISLYFYLLKVLKHNFKYIDIAAFGVGASTVRICTH